MVRLIVGLVICFVVTVALGCVSERTVPPGNLYNLERASIESLLPNLPNIPAARSTNAAGSYVFVEGDEITSQFASWAGDVMSLQQAEFSFSITSFNLGTSDPANIGVDGMLDGLWLAVSDYDTGGWHFLGKYSTPQVHGLTEGNYKSPTGWIYFALVCPEGSAADTSTTLDYETAPQTDFDPPEWQGGVGIKSLDTTYYKVTLEWFPAIDAESPPVTYLIYYAENESGIDWENPNLTVSAAFTSTTFGIDENPVLRDYAVRAKDALGNITDNMNFLSGSIPWSSSYPIIDWLPGDKVVMAWDAPIRGSYLGFTGPYHTLGSNEDAMSLEGIVEFSPLSVDSGLEEVWATLLEPSPSGGYLLEGHMDTTGLVDCVTYSYNLLDSTGALKTHIGNFTIKPWVFTASDICYLRNGPLTWPQDEPWQTGDRLEITWDDPFLNMDLWVEAPSYASGCPTYPDDLVDLVDFSQASEDTGVALEWAQLAAGGDPGLYRLRIQLMDDGGPDPPDFEVIWTLYDSEGAVKFGPGTAGISSDWGEIFHFFWLEKEE